jgi:Na+/glutamate symporter
MTEADYQLTVTTIGTVLVAVTGTITAVFGYRNHQVSQENAAKIDQVQATTNGTQHALASNLAASQSANEAIIRQLAASTIPPVPPPTTPLPPKEAP